LVSDPDVLLVGPYPPPFGGVSAHVARLAHAIAKHGMSVAVVNHFRTRETNDLIVADLARNPWRYWSVLRRLEPRVLHYHHARWSTLVAAALAVRRSSGTSVVTIHGRELEPFLESRLPGIARLTRWALTSFDVLIAVSAEIERSLRPLGRTVNVIPAFIPADDDRPLSPQANDFLDGGTNLLVSAYRLTVNRRGRLIYGLETAIQSFIALAPARPQLRLAIFLASAPRSRRERDRLSRLIEAVADDEVRWRIGVFHGEPLTPALCRATLYLRPTLTDGDAVSIREALAAGVTVLASDVVARPPGVQSLPLEVPRWVTAIERRLDGGESAPIAAATGDPSDELIAIYRGLCRRSPREVAVPVP
jgi:glycosyltransferase involved in cell wall biosynthesis